MSPADLIAALFIVVAAGGMYLTLRDLWYQFLEWVALKRILWKFRVADRPYPRSLAKHGYRR